MSLVLPTVKAISNDQFECIKILAIAIAGSEITRSKSFRHLGIFFRPGNSALSLMHMGSGLRDVLENTIPDARFCWIPCKGIDKLALQSLANWLEVMWDINGSSFPYSVLPYDEDPFDASGKLIKVDPGDGFTCSTFVMAVFDHAQLNLIDTGSWQSRLEDMHWKQWAIKNQPSKDGDHIIVQKDRADSVFRFRPEEVAGAAAIYTDSPIQFDQAVELGECVLEGMEHLNKI